MSSIIPYIAQLNNYLTSNIDFKALYKTKSLLTKPIDLIVIGNNEIGSEYHPINGANIPLYPLSVDTYLSFTF